MLSNLTGSLIWLEQSSIFTTITITLTQYIKLTAHNKHRSNTHNLIIRKCALSPVQITALAFKQVFLFQFNIPYSRKDKPSMPMSWRKHFKLLWVEGVDRTWCSWYHTIIAQCCAYMPMNITYQMNHISLVSQQQCRHVGYSIAVRSGRVMKFVMMGKGESGQVVCHIFLNGPSYWFISSSYRSSRCTVDLGVHVWLNLPWHSPLQLVWRVQKCCVQMCQVVGLHLPWRAGHDHEWIHAAIKRVWFHLQ